MNFNIKTKWIFLALIINLLAIVTRLVYLQIIHSKSFQWLGEKNFLRTKKIICPRGNITDAYGKLLATNRPILSLVWQGYKNKTFSQEQEKILKKIISHTNFLISLDEIALAEKRGQKVTLAHDISIQQVSTVLELIPDCKNLSIETSFQRFYPYGTLACHLVGYLGSVQFEASGKMGLEKIFEDTLKGKTGTIEKTINSLGKNLSQRQIKKALNGEDITTNINLDLQKLAEKVFPDYKGSFIIMESQTGAIRALVSRPSFDPNIFLKKISHEQWEKLQINQPFINRTVAACYPPASPFKLITISAALELGMINEDTTWNCKGSVTYGGRIHYCNKRNGHGTLTAKQALAQSCNIPCYELAKEMPIDTLAAYAKKFGLGQSSNCLLPEKKGFIPTTEWKQKVKGEPWWPGETLSASIGQSYLLATPMQTARMIGSIIEGYFVTPRILSDEPIETSPLEIEENVRKFLKKSMKMVVTIGTGKRLNLFNEIKIYAKTGTAQVCALQKRNKKATDRDHAWFVAHVTIKNQKPLVFIIILENAGAGRYALEVAKKFIHAMNEYKFPS